MQLHKVNPIFKYSDVFLRSTPLGQTQAVCRSSVTEIKSEILQVPDIDVCFIVVSALIEFTVLQASVLKCGLLFFSSFLLLTFILKCVTGISYV